MNATPENAEVMEEYQTTLQDRATVPLVIHFPIAAGHRWQHGDVMEVPIVGVLPDGANVDLAFPDRVRIVLNLWGADEQTVAFLRWIVHTWKPTVVFETGTHKGRSTKAIADALEYNGAGHITTVDIADHGVAARVPRTTFVEGKLPAVLDDPALSGLKDIDMAYLDGPHTAAEIAAEVQFVLDRKSARGCYILFDDAASSAWPEVGEYVRKAGGLILPTPHGLGILRIAP